MSIVESPPNLDELASKASSDPPSFFQLLSLLSTQFHAFQLHSKFDPSNNLYSELTSVKTHFLRLKAQFLQWETKKRMMATLIEKANEMKASASSGVTNENIPIDLNVVHQQSAALEKSIEGTSVSLLKEYNDIATIKAKLKALIEEMIYEWNSICEEMEAFKGIYNEEDMRDNKEVIERIIEAIHQHAGEANTSGSDSSPPPSVDVHPSPSSIATYEMLLNSHSIQRIVDVNQSQINQIERDILSYRLLIEKLDKDTIRPMEDENVKITEKIEGIKRGKFNAANIDKEEMEGATEWYTEMREMVEGIQGVRILKQVKDTEGENGADENAKEVDNGEWKVEISFGSKKIDIIMEMSEDSDPSTSTYSPYRLPRRLLGVRLLFPSVVVHFDSIVDYAIETQDVTFLLRELQSTLMD